MKVLINGFSVEGSVDEVKELIGGKSERAPRGNISHNSSSFRRGKIVSEEMRGEATTSLLALGDSMGLPKLAKLTGVPYATLHMRSNGEKNRPMRRSLYDAIMRVYQEHGTV